MSAVTHDPCFLYKRRAMSPDRTTSSHALGFTCFQTDDMACAGTRFFINQEAKISERLDSRPVQILKSGRSINLYGMEIKKEENIYSISQTDHTNRLTKIADTKVNKKEFVTQRARGAYIAAVCQPDVTLGFSHASQIISRNSSTAKALNKNVGLAKLKSANGLKFVKIHAKSIR